MASGAEAFARTVLALQPYAGDVVFIGGWIHALYLAEANASDRPVRTEDIDVTLPHTLLAGDRPTLLELAVAARFEVQEFGAASGVFEIFQQDRDGTVIELDLLTESPDPRTPVEIEGQHGLMVHGYPGQQVFLENARWMSVGPDIHPLLDPPCRIRVPTIAAYMLGKALSSASRTRLSKQAKDLVYLYEIARSGAGRQQRGRDSSPACTLPCCFRGMEATGGHAGRFSPAGRDGGPVAPRVPGDRDGRADPRQRDRTIQTPAGRNLGLTLGTGARRADPGGRLTMRGDVHLSDSSFQSIIVGTINQSA